MPINQKHYHPDWKDKIRPRILKRDQYRCAICRVPNKIEILRLNDGSWLKADDLIRREAAINGQKIIRIILTVAHLNHIVTDNRDENLKSLCQLHHIHHDRKHKVAMREVSNVWDPELAIAKTKEVNGELYLNHLFVLARARRNQVATYLKIRESRAKYKEYSKYDQELKLFLAKSQIEYKNLVKRICEMLVEHYAIEDGREFLAKYWESDTKFIGGKSLGLTVPSI